MSSFGLDMVGWKDYQGVEGFHGAATQQDLNELNKALSAGQEINPPGSVVSGDGFALRVESLERTLKNVSFKMSHIRLWRAIGKIPAFNTVEEHNEIQEYGANPDAGFIDEGDLPEEDDSKYERKFSIIRYLGTVRRVTHVMSLVKPAAGNVISQETVNGTMHLLRVLERALFYGDNSLSNLQFDGYEKLMIQNAAATNVIDLRGAPLSEDVLMDACMTAQDAPNYGQITHAFLNPKVKSDLSKQFFPKERHNTLTDHKGVVGLDITGFTSPAGDVSFEPDVFINDGGGPTAGIGDAAKRPGTPTITSAPAVANDAASQFGADDAGDYFYQAQAVNRYGRSASIIVPSPSAAITLAAGEKMTVGLTPGGAVAVEWYEVFRTKVGGAVGTERQILRVPNAAGAGQQLLVDLNDRIPGTTSGFLFQMNLESMSFKQLAPMVKIPLATIDSSIRWMQLLYGTPVLYIPGKNILFRNIGRAAGYVGAG